MIFSHISYIEAYRRYILQIKNLETEDYRANLSRCIICRIEKYLSLYENKDICYQTVIQNEVALTLRKHIEIIKERNFRDFETKIEVPDAE